jgi:hypothetical protein
MRHDQKETTMANTTNDKIAFVAETFVRELRALREKTGNAGLWRSDEIRLIVEMNGDEAKFELACRSNGETVRAATLSELMTEMYRRAGFNDYQAGKLTAIADRLSTPALPAPREG